MKMETLQLWTFGFLLCPMPAHAVKYLFEIVIVWKFHAMTKIIENIARAYNHVSMLRRMTAFPCEVALVDLLISL